jgi:hypothetical protein
MATPFPLSDVLSDVDTKLAVIGPNIGVNSEEVTEGWRHIITFL